jgi:tRNA nucleotidyltransferase (CCA-adding enzyme)
MKIYLVGGAVRDELLGLPVQERDYLVVGATERDVLERGFRRLDAAFPVYLHPQTGDEYALARRERKTGPGYKGFAVDAGPDVTLEEDLARRDLTVNAMARDDSGILIDPFGGRADLDEGQLRHITPAFQDDPVRLLRAARFCARLGRWGFRVAHGTFALLRRMAALQELTTVVPDRLREEMLKALAAEQPWRFFETLQRCGALERLIPPLALALGASGGHADATVSAPLRALQRVARASPDPATRLAALMSGALPDLSAARAWGEALRLDRATRTLLERALRWSPEWLANAAPETWLSLLEQLRALHDPNPLRQLAQVWRARDPQAGVDAARRLALAFAAVSSVEPSALRQQGLAGAQLGRRLRELRLRALAQAL